MSIYKYVSLSSCCRAFHMCMMGVLCYSSSNLIYVHLSDFHFFSFINNAVSMFFFYQYFCDKFPRNGITESKACLILSEYRCTSNCLWKGFISLSSHWSEWMCFSPCHSASVVCHQSFLLRQSVGISLFKLAVLQWRVRLSSFFTIIGHLYFFGELSLHVLCSFLHQVVYLAKDPTVKW